MNLNTIDPFLYNGRDSLNADSIMRYQNLKEKKNNDKATHTTDFLNQINEDIRKSLPGNIKSKLSSEIFYSGMNRKEIMEETENSPDKRKLYEAAKEFESFFVEKMFVEMKKNIPKNEMFHGGQAEEIFDDMLLSERVRKMSGATEFGLAEKMYQQLSVIY